MPGNLSGFVLVFLLLNVERRSADEELKHLTSKEEIFQKSRKLWHLYIRSFLHHFLPVKAKQMFKVYLVAAIKLQNLYSKHFLSYYVNEHHFIVKQHKVNIKGDQDFTIEFASQEVVTKASGQLVSQGHRYHKPAVAQIWKGFFQVNATWNFFLDKILQLNITFDKIHFQLSRANCHKGSLLISNTMDCAQNFTYCGIKSAFNLYPNFNNIRITAILRTSTEITFFIQMYFIVFDCGVLYISEPKASDLSYRLSRTVQIREAKVFICSHWLQVNKTYFIVLVLKSMKATHLVFDGPSYLFKLEQVKQTYQLSSFQCIVQVKVNFSTIVRQHFSYSSVKLKFTSNTHVGGQPQMISSLNLCKTSPCLLHLETVKHQINVTLTNFTYHSNGTLACRFGGLVFVGETGTHDTLCEFIDLDLYPTNFYSTKNKFVILVFWYDSYTQVKAVFSASLTKCKAVTIDFCAQAFCAEGFNANRGWQYLTEFSCQHDNNACLHLHHSTRFSNMAAKCIRYGASDGRCRRGFFDERYRFAINVALQERTCSILQIRETGKLPFAAVLHRCFIGLYFGNSSGESIEYNITGEPLSNLFYHGQIENLCQQGQKTLCHKYTRVEIPQHFEENLTKVFIKGKSTKPPYAEQCFNFFVFTEVNLPTKNWADIVLKGSESTYKVDTQSLTETIGLTFNNIYYLKLELEFDFYFLLMKGIFSKRREQRKNYTKTNAMHLKYRGFLQRQMLTVILSVEYSMAKQNNYVKFFFHRRTFDLMKEKDNTDPSPLQFIETRWLDDTSWKENTSIISFSCNVHYLCYNITKIAKSCSSELIYTAFKNQKENQDLISWTEAHLLCKHSGAVLPVFTDEDLLWVFLSEIKSFEKYLLAEAVFIGLQRSSARVRSL